MNSFKEIKADIKQLQDDIKEMKDGFTPAINQNASDSLINNLLKLEKEHFELQQGIVLKYWVYQISLLVII